MTIILIPFNTTLRQALTLFTKFTPQVTSEGESHFDMTIGVKNWTHYRFYTYWDPKAHSTVRWDKYVTTCCNGNITSYSYYAMGIGYCFGVDNFGPLRVCGTNLTGSGPNCPSSGGDLCGTVVDPGECSNVNSCPDLFQNATGRVLEGQTSTSQYCM